MVVQGGLFEEVVYSERISSSMEWKSSNFTANEKFNSPMIFLAQNTSRL
jgi:hypothetical protein